MMHARQLHRLIAVSRHCECRQIKHQTTPSIPKSSHGSQLPPFLLVQLARQNDEAQKGQVPDESENLPRQNEQKMLSQLEDAEMEAAKILGREQLETERRTLSEATQTYQKLARTLIEGGVGAEMKPSERLCVSWFAPLYMKIAEEKEEIIRTKNETGKPYACVLLAPQIDERELACITLHEVMSLILVQPMGVPYTKVAKAIGKAVEFQLNMTNFKQDEQLALGANVLFKKLERGGNWKKVKLARSIAEGEWPETLLLQTGSFLLDKLVECAQIESEEEGSTTSVPALSVDLVQPHKLYKNNMHKQRVVRGAQKVYDIIDKRVLLSGRLFVVNKPMVCPPQPWTQPDLGGYLSYKTKLIRTNSVRHQTLLHSADLSKIYSPLNYLGSVPWQINSRVFDIVKTLWEAGGAVAGLVSSQPLPPLELKDTLTPKQVEAAKKDYDKKKKELYSQKCDIELKLQSAKDYEGRRIFFPCNIDFRGRVYPLPPHLNHLGADLARSLLRFDVGRPLGKNGLKWLKIHLANMSGRDKLSFEDREAWTNEHLKEVEAVFRDPLGEQSADGLWWQGLENPLQGLATCFELHEALQNPDTFLSHLPIHMDGSCNGLQHYGALGRDQAGGSAVNLVPHDKPQDVYNGVLERVKVRMAAHHKSSDPLEQQMSLLLDGKITRKIVKQTVMTSVYGVTLLGAKQQVLNRLREADNIQWPEADRDFIMSKAALYVAKLALDSLGDLFASAEQIMNWLRQVARLVTGEEQQPVTWVTPLGLPVLQPYVRKQEYQVATHNYRLTIANNSDLMPVSASKQKSALPPNFVHSLDATHMLMTTTDCARRGLHFAAVHDSFWTHAGNIDDMNESLRVQFVNLYSEPILEDFREFLAMRFPAVNFPPLPKCGTLDIKQVLKSKYFFA